MNAEPALFCYVYKKKVSTKMVETTRLETLQHCRHTVNASERVMDPTLVQCAFEYIHIILLLHISPHAETSEKRA